VINALLLLLTAQIAASLGVQFTVDGFFSALLGGVVIALVSLVLNILAGEIAAPVVVIRRQ
jgi:putative membrane protein